MGAKNVVITGANSGIGYQAALHFARDGASVVMACRSMEKAETARRQIQAEIPEADTRIIQLDVSDLDSVREFSGRFAEEVGELDLLINNAGIVAIPLSRNGANHELQLATNYLGAFALTGLLLPSFASDNPARIVNVGSLAHRFGRLNVDDLNWEHCEYKQWRAYANSKLATLSFTLELNRRLRRRGSNIIALAAHPGFANTNIHQNSPALSHTNPLIAWFNNFMKRFIPSAADAARPIILAAESEDVEGGDYYGPGGFLEIGGAPAKARINPIAKDTELARQLWSTSESMTGVSFLSDL